MLIIYGVLGKNPKRPVIETGGKGNRRKNRNHEGHIVDNGEKTKKIPGDLEACFLSDSSERRPTDTGVKNSLRVK